MGWTGISPSKATIDVPTPSGSAKIHTPRLNYGTIMDLTSLSDFNAVALHGGFGPASRALDRPKATLSRRVAELEAQLGVRLIERGSRRLLSAKVRAFMDLLQDL